MSEYSKFLNYFNTKKASEKAENTKGKEAPETVAETAEPEVPAVKKDNAGDFEIRTEDPVRQAEKTDGAGEFEIRTDFAAKEAEPQKNAPPAAGGKKFIRSNQPQVVSTNKNRDESSTDVEKYTDRLGNAGLDTEPEHTGYTGKINTASPNRAGESKQTMITPADNGSGSLFSEAVASRKNLFADVSEKPAVTEDATKVITSPGKTEEPVSAADDAPTKPINSEKASLLMEIAKSSAEEAGEDPEQLVLEGFADEKPEEKPEEKTEEKEMRSELSKVRQKRINDFHFWNKAHTEAGKSDDGIFTAEEKELKKTLPEKMTRITSKFEGIESGFLKFRCDEYKDANEHRAVFKKLIDIRQTAFIRMVILAVLGAVLLIINIAAAVTAASHNGFITILGGSGKAYITVNLVFLAAAAATAAEDIKNGVITLLQGHPKTDSSLAFMYLVTFIETAAAYLSEQKIESDYHLFAGAVILLTVPLMLAKVFYYDNTRHCFKSVASKSDKSYLRTLSDKQLTASVLAESGSKKSNVVYPGKTRFISNFIDRSRSSAFGGQTSSRLALISMAVCILVGLLTMIIKGNVLLGLSAACLGSALSFPVGCILFTGFMIAGENKALSVKSSFIRSYSDARDLASVDNIVLRAEDLFSVEITETVCAEGVSRKQAEFCAAAITANAGGLLKKAFENTDDFKDTKLPEAENLTYEDKLGFSAWISDCRVLLGSNAFLVNHNVRMPDESGVLNFIDNENKPIYLAIEGHFTTMFSAKYSCRTEAVKNLKVLADNGTNILIISSDPNITDTFAESLLGLPADSVRIISKNAGEKIAAQQQTITDSADTGIVFTDTAALCRCAYSALKLDKLKKLAKLICEIGAGCGLALTALLSLMNAVSAMSWWLPVVLQILWIALCFFVPPLLTASFSPALEKSAVRPVSRNEAYTPENYTPRPRRITDEDEDINSAEDGKEIEASDTYGGNDGEDADDEYDAKPVKIAQKTDFRKEKTKNRAPEPRKRSLLSFLRDDDDDEDDDDEYYDGYGNNEDDGYYDEDEYDDEYEDEYEDEYDEEYDDEYDDEDEADGGYDPYSGYEDREITTEELLQSHFFRDEDEKPARADRKASSRPGDAYPEDEDEYYDDEEPRRRKGGKQPVFAGLLRGAAEKASTAGKAAVQQARKTAGSGNNSGKRPVRSGKEVFRTSSSPAVNDRRYGGAAKPITQKRSIISFADEDPEPPKYEPEDNGEFDFLNTKFEPPTDSGAMYYSDSLFSRFETEGTKRSGGTERPAAPGRKPGQTGQTIPAKPERPSISAKRNKTDKRKG